MRTNAFLLLLAVVLFIADPLSSPFAAAQPAPASITLPVYFEANRGQFTAEVAAAARTRSYTALFTQRGVLLAVPGQHALASLEFAGGTRTGPRMTQPLDGRVHFLIGSEHEWVRDVPTFARVRYSNVYPGIDVEFYAAGGRLEYDFIVAPRADAGRIALAMKGETRPAINAAGDLELPLAAGLLIQHRPTAYQMKDGAKHVVDSSYRIDRSGRIRIELGPYDRSLPLTIDPVLTYSSSFVGRVFDLAADGSGSLYVTGWTESASFPTTSGAYDRTFGGEIDVYVAKLNAAGDALVYSTYLGGSRTDRGDGIAVDGSGNAYVTGDTVSPDFPTTSGAWDRSCGGDGTCANNDGFAVKLNASGSALAYATFIGGAGTDLAYGIAVDGSGQATIAGSTRSTDFPTTPGAFQQAKPGESPFQDESFAVKLNASGSAPVFSTYLGGANDDGFVSVAIDATGNILLVGETESADFPVVAPLQPSLSGPRDAFVLKFNPAGTALFATYFGGAGDDIGAHGAFDGSGNPYVLGQTYNGSYTGTVPRVGPGGGSDLFVAKLTPAGTSLTWAAVIGGTLHEGAHDIEVDASLRTHISGTTGSTDFPVTSDAVQTVRRDVDAFYVALNSSGSRVYATYLGGGLSDWAARVEVAGTRAWLAGATDSADFPQVNARGAIGVPGNDGWIARFDWAVPPPTNDPRELVLYAADAENIGGAWRLVSDASAAAGRRMYHPNAGAARITAPLANPTHSWELTFNAVAGVSYRIWMRGRADSNHWSNDSVYVQFSGSVTSSGSPTWRIGTTSGTTVQIENCTNCGLRGWGWNDNGFDGFGPLVRFATTGPQRLRIQTREDGISIDQVVLSSSRYLSTSPGAARNDSTVLPPSDGSGSEPPPTTCEAGEIVMHTIDATVHGQWVKLTDTTAASSTRAIDADSGAPRVAAPLAAPVNFIELTFFAEANVDHRLWIRGRAVANHWANDSAYVQFSDSITASGGPLWRIGTTSGTRYQLEDCDGCGVSGWGWNDNAGVALGTPVRFATTGMHTIRIQTREDGLSIDQIVLSAERFLTTPPGPLKNDATILDKCSRPATSTTP
jgi:hypothetical protein